MIGFALREVCREDVVSPQETHECDGATYHSSRSARDRDRIRQDVLEDRGWRIHRIWSTDWFNAPDQEIDRCLEAMESARIFNTRFVSDDPAVDEPVTTATSNEIHREAVSRSEEPALSEPYREASFNVPQDQAIHEIPTRRLATIITQIVEVEGLIHGDEVACRVRMLWGLGRTGSRITQAVHHALKAAQNSGSIKSDGAFYAIAGVNTVAVRNRDNVRSPSLRYVPMIPPKELAEAVMRVVIAHYGVRKAEVATIVSRIMGFRSTSAQMRDAIETQLDVLISNDRLKLEGDALQAVPTTTPVMDKSES